MKQIFGQDAYIFHSKLNFKAPFEGTVWMWHQDYGYWQYDGVDDRLVSVLVMFGDNTIHNGCLLPRQRIAQVGYTGPLQRRGDDKLQAVVHHA